MSAKNDIELIADCHGLTEVSLMTALEVIVLEVAIESRGGMYMTIDELAPHGDESVEFLVNDEVFYHEGDLTVPVRPDSGMDCTRVLL